MDLRSIFSRSKQTSTSKRIRRTDNISSAGAHELFLEYEGFLGPSKSRPRRPSTAGTRLATPRVADADSKSKVKLSQDLPRDSKTLYDESRKSFSGLRDATDDPRSPTKRISSRRKKGLFSLSRSTRDESEDYPDKHSLSSCLYALGQENVDCRPTRGWLRRCMSTNSRRHPSPPHSFTTIPPYHASPILEDDDYTALPILPNYENGPYRPLEKLPSGAAARAAAAAQAEVLNIMENLRLAEPKTTRDSESGVGIEVRDRGDLVADFDFDITVVRKGKLNRYLMQTSFAKIYDRSLRHSSRGISWTDISLSRRRLLDECGNGLASMESVSELALCMARRFSYRISGYVSDNCCS